MPIAGTVQITGQLAPTATTDVFPTHDAQYGLDGMRSVADATARNAITSGRCRKGMLVALQSDLTVWQLNTASPTGTNADWTQFAAVGAPDDASLQLAGRVFQAHPQPPGTAVATTATAVDDASLQLAGRVFQSHPQPNTPAAAVATTPVDDSSLQLAVRVFQYHQVPVPVAAVAAATPVDDASLQLAGRVFQIHQAPAAVAAVAASATDVLQTQVFGV